jgi:hypothetical protein
VSEGFAERDPAEQRYDRRVGGVRRSDLRAHAELLKHAAARRNFQVGGIV